MASPRLNPTGASGTKPRQKSPANSLERTPYVPKGEAKYVPPHLRAKKSSSTSSTSSRTKSPPDLQEQAALDPIGDSRSSTPPNARSSSTTRIRQRPPPDPLDQVGFVSKGDTKLLDIRAQDAYYKRIIDRYAQFCKDYSGDLDAAFASLPRERSDDATRNPPVPLPQKAGVGPEQGASKAGEGSPILSASEHPGTRPPVRVIPPPGKELSTLLLSLRKLREAILATAAKTSIHFAQSVHIFCVRTALLANHPPSYYHPLERLVKQLNSSSHPLDPPVVKEFTTYLILDYACRQGDLSAAYELRAKSRLKSGYQSSIVDRVLSALAHDDWVLFWKAREDGDGYTRSLMDWAVDTVRRRTLKAIGRAYLMVDSEHIVRSCTGSKDGCTWEELAEREGLGWKKEGTKVIIRARKLVVDQKRSVG